MVASVPNAAGARQVKDSNFPIIVTLAPEIKADPTKLTGLGRLRDGGNSGSLIVGTGRRAVALLLAGDQGGANGQGLTYANPIHTVLGQLKIQLAL